VRRLVLTARLLSSRLVSADDEVEPDYPPFRTLATAGRAQWHGSHEGGQYESGFGPSVEVALGSGRWQYTVEGSVATSATMEASGSLARGVAGVRWLARQFAPASAAGIELFLTAAAGGRRFAYDDATATRAELDLGAGLQVRRFSRPHLALRLDVRAVFTGGTRTGTLTGVSVAW